MKQNSKEKILFTLSENKEKQYSIKDFIVICNVSRQAVSKAVNDLSNEGLITKYGRSPKVFFRYLEKDDLGTSTISYCHEIEVQEPFFAQMKNGSKLVEGRLNKSKFAKIKIGDFLMVNGVEKFEITNKKLYVSFRDMLIFEGINNVIPKAKNLDDALSVYNNFYSKADQLSFGVSAIKIKLSQ
jgi:ASC-1-like (ASCH) protein/predicted transcriptional regulator